MVVAMSLVVPGACASDAGQVADVVESATTVAPAATQVAPDAGSVSDVGELATTVVTGAGEADSPGDTVAEEPGGVQPEGFTTTTVRITKPDGEVCDVCMWLADDADERGRGLMGVTDLGDAAGIVFAFDELRFGNFFMFETVTPLSIAWFDDVGSFVSSADMDPCPFEDSSRCERFPADGPYMSAIEVFQGDLAALGIGPGSTAVIVEGTEAERCPAA